MGQAALKSVDGKPTLDVSGVLDLVSEKAPEARKNRKISDDVIEAIRETGFFRSMLPKKYGGLESSPQEFFQAAIDISERDMSTSWVAGIIGCAVGPVGIVFLTASSRNCCTDSFLSAVGETFTVTAVCAGSNAVDLPGTSKPG